ncbi:MULTISPECIES: hypothetical protein [unclassified Spirosoma]|uniref:hypothetical protein n=1 Tax=unclassified Spirosoma TaxID=2621999 RepID=UPI000960E6DF|nr:MULTISPECIES: hypothetical protein [unclassified Spirosoma]MBN8823661.1 hypothetical protein [Spirosoma sp.]OJW76786.1 MAG: hypothetical protein BGO59_21365 [Spirosoma sp. 48-14]
MEAVEAILQEVDKLKPNEKLQLLHQLVDRMLAARPTELPTIADFDKYIGIGKGVWETDAQTYINKSREED